MASKAENQRSLDELYKMLAYIYSEQNAQLVDLRDLRPLLRGVRNAHDLRFKKGARG